MKVLGLMSGSSADGIDAAIVELAGAPPKLDWRLVKHVSYPFTRELQEAIIACAAASSGTVDRICALNFQLGELFVGAALGAIEAAGLARSDVQLIGSHGQTVWHVPRQSTLQLGEPAIIAERTGITTISSLRARDIAVGGHGAPLVAYVDALLYVHPDRIRAIQNIGGIANVTFVPPVGSLHEPFAFDTGPGNILIDQMVRRATEGEHTFDVDGRIAEMGTVNARLLAELLEHPFLREPPPKSTGREMFDKDFAGAIWQRGVTLGLTGDDVVATCTAFTVESILKAYRAFLPAFPDEVILSGGGAKNPVLLRMLRGKLGATRLSSSDDYGLPSQAKEAVAFAILAYESYHNRKGNLPSATGAGQPVILGNITPGRGPISSVASDTSSLTEQSNALTRDIDELSTFEMVRRINLEDANVAEAIKLQLPEIAGAIDLVTERMRIGGRLIYVGAGTSGRLGVLDASEMPPTFGVSPDTVIGVIAGGDEAIRHSVEGVEDDVRNGEWQIAEMNVGAQDSVVGLSASGRTPFVIAALDAARKRGALTVSVACNEPALIQSYADINITPLVGPEVIAGSTRLKAGTAEKMVLNLISTGVMIKLGKTFGNLMVDVQPTNTKLRDRALRIVEGICNIPRDEALSLLDRTNWQVKTAIVSQLAKVAPDTARRRLDSSGGSVRRALTISD